METVPLHLNRIDGGWVWLVYRTLSLSTLPSCSLQGLTPCQAGNRRSVRVDIPVAMLSTPSLPHHTHFHLTSPSHHHPDPPPQPSFNLHHSTTKPLVFLLSTSTHPPPPLLHTPTHSRLNHVDKQGAWRGDLVVVNLRLGQRVWRARREERRGDERRGEERRREEKRREGGGAREEKGCQWAGGQEGGRRGEGGKEGGGGQCQWALVVRAKERSVLVPPDVGKWSTRHGPPSAVPRNSTQHTDIPHMWS